VLSSKITLNVYKYVKSRNHTCIEQLYSPYGSIKQNKVK